MTLKRVATDLLAFLVNDLMNDSALDEIITQSGKNIKMYQKGGFNLMGKHRG